MKEETLNLVILCGGLVLVSVGFNAGLQNEQFAYLGASAPVQQHAVRGAPAARA